MERRLPSSLVTGDSPTIRRRSGGIDKSPKLLSHSQELPSSSCVTSARLPHSQQSASPNLLTVQVEDMDDTDSKPVVLLVQSGAPSPPMSLRRSTGLSSKFNFQDRLQREANLQGAGSNNNTFTEVPLTPCLDRCTSDDSPKRSTSRFSVQTPSKWSKFLSSKLSTFGRSSKSSVPSERCSAFSDHENTEGKDEVTARPSLVPSSSSYSSTSEKYTQKWPKPRLNPRAIGGLVAAIDDSEGMGMDSVDRWTTHKWVLLISVIAVFVYSFAGMVCAVLTWFRGWEHADVMYVADGDILALVTIAASILIFTSLVGMCGTLLNSRPLLAIYCLLLWAAFISLAAVGYTTYRRAAYSLDRKLNLAWSQWYSPISRMIIQNSLRCCGYYNSLHEATSSKRCFPRTTLPGCKGKLYQFERHNLDTIWSAVFALVPIHLIAIMVSLLCSHHVTKRFGKGITPRQYRLMESDLKIDAESLFSKFKDAGVISKPSLSRAPSSAIFREDRTEKTPLCK